MPAPPEPSACREIADALRGSDVPVLVKNPIDPDLKLWAGALERLHNAGITRLAAVHRGFSWFERTPYLQQPDVGIPIRLKGSSPTSN